MSSASRLSSTTRTLRDTPVATEPVETPELRGRRGRLAGGQRQAHGERLPLPGPSLCASMRAAMQLDQRFATARPRPRPPCGAIDRRARPARTGRRRAAAAPASMPMPLSVHVDHDLVAVGAARPARCGRPARCTSRRWSAGWRAPARGASGRRRPAARSPARRPSQADGRALDQRAWRSRRRRSTAAELERLRCAARPCRA